MQSVIPEVVLKISWELENMIYLSSRIPHKLVSYFHQVGERVIGFKCQDVLYVGLKSHIYFLSHSFYLWLWKQHPLLTADDGIEFSRSELSADLWPARLMQES